MGQSSASAWKIAEALPDRATCERKKRTTLDQWKDLSGYEVSEDSLAWGLGRGAQWRKDTYKCVPDTVDPRGPKGK